MGTGGSCQNKCIETQKSTNEFTIRDATPADAERIVEILRGGFAEFAGLFDPPSGALSETVETVNEKLQQGRCFLGVSEDGPVACVFARKDGDDMYLYRLAVLPNYRGSGMGVALTRKVEDYAAQTGLKRVRLGTRLAVARNIRYYERLGYKHTEDGVHPVTGKAFYAVMVKEL